MRTDLSFQEDAPSCGSGMKTKAGWVATALALALAGLTTRGGAPPNAGLSPAAFGWHGGASSVALPVPASVQGSPLVDIQNSTDLNPRTALRDFAFLRDRVVEEHGWSPQKAEAAIFEYLRFLRLLAEAPKMELVASEPVDLVWHEHLLDTTNYAEDCLRLFGRFLHHRRARTDAEFADIPSGYERSKQVYEARYKTIPPNDLWGPTTTSASMCGGSKKKDCDGNCNGDGGRDPYDLGPFYTNCEMSEREQCENARGATVSAIGATAENRACKQALIHFGYSYRAQTCGGQNVGRAADRINVILSPCLLFALALSL